VFVIIISSNMEEKPEEFHKFDCSV
jgi:hypothetical protein